MTTGRASKQRSGRKRGNNEGTIVLRNDGRWTAAVTVPGGKRKWLYGKTRKEVQEQLTAVLRDVQQGMPIPTSRQTVGQFLRRWLQDAARPTVAPATYDSYRRMMDRHILPALDTVPLEKLTPQHVQRLQARMSAAGLSPRTVAYARAILRRALGQAVKWGILARNVATLVDPPKQQRSEPEFLTADEARRLMAGIAGDRLEPLVLLTLVTGLRRGEVLSLRWHDLDLDDGVLRVEGQYQKWDGEWTWLPLKSRESRRTLALAPFVVQSLRQHRTRQLQERLAAGGTRHDFDLVFCTEMGTPMDGPNLTRQFQRRLRRAGVRSIPFHGLRHSAATLLLARGLTIGQIQKILGHATGRLTSDLYSHYTREIADQAASEMQALFGTG
jgi:integrase